MGHQVICLSPHGCSVPPHSPQLMGTPLDTASSDGPLVGQAVASHQQRGRKTALRGSAGLAMEPEAPNLISWPRLTMTLPRLFIRQECKLWEQSSHFLL